MLIGGIVLGLLLGLVLGGRLDNLADVRLRYLPLLFLAVIARFGTETLLSAGVDIVETLRLPLFVLAYGILLVGLWANRALPGIALAFVGVLLNAIAITLNLGYMPIWEPSLRAAGFTPDQVTSVFHVILPAALDANFLIRGGPIGDVIPVPVPFIQNVASIGDLFLSLGLGFFLFAIVLRRPAAELEEVEAEDVRRYRGLAGTTRLPRPIERALDTTGRMVRPGTGLPQGLAETAALERPLVLGAQGTGMSGPALAPLPEEGEIDEPRGSLGLTYGSGGTAAIPLPGGIAVPRPSVLDRARRHPYVRLALNGSFSALWAGQLISLFGDRMHQVALAILVAGITESAFAVAFVFVAATLPNLLLSPIAGVFVDRWDHKETLVVSDLLRAAIALTIPVAVVINVLLVYPLVFLITTVSIFFRPARVAILPRIVKDDELLSANSALWVGETLADVIGYPIAGVFVAFLGSSLVLAFWFDAMSYVGSAILLMAMVVPPLARRARRPAEAGAADAEAAGSADEPERPHVLDDLKVGWRFLRAEPVLLTNTIQGAIGQIGAGTLTAIAPSFAIALVGTATAGAAYAFLETAIGVGNLLGGFALGLIGTRLAKGQLVIWGYIGMGVALVVLGLVGELSMAIGLMLGVGLTNMVFVIPSQTLFQERTPAEMIGRVVGFRFALVFGSMTISMAVSGVLAELLGPAAVITLAGLFPIAAGVLGWLVRPAREA